MHESLRTKATFKTKVTALSEARETAGTLTSIEVKTENEGGKASVRSYSAVISTVPLPRLRMMDLTGCALTYGQWNAIRGLGYGPAVKVSPLVI